MEPQAPQQSTPQPASTGRAGFALALAVGGFCLWPLGVGALVESLRITRNPRARGSAAQTVAMVALCIAPFSLVTGLGACVAVAIPGMVYHARRSRVGEAEANVARIFTAVEQFAAQPHARPDGTVGPGVLPASISLTPARPSCDRQPWPAGADPAWRALGFAPDDSVYYGYELAVAADGRRFAVRAIGDLDCDGVQSLFERTGVIEGGRVRPQVGIFVEREVE